MFYIHVLCKGCHIGKRYMVFAFCEHFRKQKHNFLFIKLKEILFWNLRIWMCFSAVKCNSNYVRDFRLAKQGLFFLLICVYEWERSHYEISWLFLIQNKICRSQKSNLLSCPLDQGHKPKKTIWSQSKNLFRRIKLPLMSK